MKRQIWKYEISLAKETFTVAVPKGAMFLTAQILKGTPVMWALVQAGGPLVLEHRRFVLFETGVPLDYPGVLRFIATLQFDEGKYIVHLFEIDIFMEELS